MATKGLLDWTDADYVACGHEPRIAAHGLHDNSLFSQESLIALLDEFPRSELQAYTMGREVTRPNEWATVDIGEASGAQLWQAVAKGRIWLNLLWAERFDTRLATLLDEMYSGLSARVPYLRGYEQPHMTLLISSPAALVYYHFDAEDNMLWHVRGEKTIWVYPRRNLELLPDGFVENVYARVRNENMPYDPSYDAQAVRFDMRPGDVASWPHNSPHRIVNGDSVNVSLSTSVITPDNKRRALTHGANRWLRQHIGLKQLSARHSGPAPSAKRFAFRVVKRLGGVKPAPGREHIAHYRVDPNADNALRKLDAPVRAAFSKV